MRITLEPYQESMRDFLLSKERAYCCVGLGLGKTSSTLAALQELFVNGECRSALVVAPLRVAKMTWPNEIAKWDEFRWMKIEHLRNDPPSGNAQIYTINYERLDRLTDLSFCDVVIFDEITRAKNPKSKRIKAIMPLLQHHRRWGLTGTPRPNSLLELFGQVRLLDDGRRLSPSFTRFRDSYFYPTDYMRYNWVPQAGAEQKVYAKISDLTLTLRSSDYLDIKDTIVEDIEVALPDCVKEDYRELEREFLINVPSGGEVVARNAAVLVGKLLQICGGTVYTDTGEVEELHDSKIKALRKLLTELDEPAIVACQYIHERERICREIPDCVDASKFKGDIETEWNSGKIKTLVADPRSLGHGLNLQGGGRVIVWFSPTWSRELYDQFNARVIRKGQGLQPLIYRILCPATIDDAVIESLREKGEGQQAMLRIMSNYKAIKS